MVFAELGEFQEVENGTREDSGKVQEGGKIVKFDLCVIRLIANIESATGNGGAERTFYMAIGRVTSTRWAVESQ